MDIEAVHIGMKLRNPACGRTGKVIRIEKEGGLELAGCGLTWDEHVENVEPVREFQVGDRVRQIGPSQFGFTDNMGQIGTIDQVHEDGTFDVTWGNGHGNTMLPASIERVGPCESCEMASVITSQCKQIAELQRSVEAWTDTAARHCRNETYYRDQLYTLQKEALAECRPLMEVAKCYKQVEPEELLLSQDARRVIEFLTATDTPVAFWRIAEGMKDLVSGAAIIDGLIEAREAGIVRLDEGKYSLVRD